MGNLAQKLNELGRTAAHPSSQPVYQPRQRGLKSPKLPEFTMFAEERQHRKERLVAVCRVFALHNLDYGFADHLAVRGPEFPELYWTNPVAVHFPQIKLSSPIPASHNGKAIEGSYALNHAGFVLHTAVHEVNPDITATCHAHTVYDTAFVALGQSLDPITQDVVASSEGHVVIKDEAGTVAVEEGVSTSICSYFKNVKVAIYQNHGLLTANCHSIEAAAFWLITLKHCCQ